MKTHPVIELEKAALDRWCNGDPDGFLEISASDVVYFDPFLPTRLDGLDQLKAHYDGIRGKIHAPRHELIDPHVQEIGDAAILHSVSSPTAAARGPRCAGTAPRSIAAGPKAGRSYRPTGRSPLRVSGNGRPVLPMLIRPAAKPHL